MISAITPQEVILLREKAIEAQKQAYCPYSNYKVGAALLTEKGEVFLGANIENASYGLGNCAERSAIFSAISQGERSFKAMGIITQDGGFSCGACRQVLNEFSPQIPIYIFNGKGELLASCTLDELLPQAFGPQNVL